jgi:hypothetical protein
VTQQRHEKPVAGFPLRFRVVRSDRPFALFGNWFTTLDPPMDAAELDTVELPFEGGSIPIQEVRESSAGATHIAAALFVYDERPVGSLLHAQLQGIGQQLLRGTLPITMYVVDGLAPAEREDLVETPAQAWLLEVWKQHRMVCGP